MSGTSTPLSDHGATTPQTLTALGDLNMTSSLHNLQTDEQRRVLDTVAQVRKCGLESILSLPQLVVCGDQSAGKSSVLEALTEIPFPRNDNLCTRFATEIILRRGPVNTLTIKVIPDGNRPHNEQEKIRAFVESITDFNDLPRIMEMAMTVMGLASNDASLARAFAKDVLSIEIEGPTRPQLTLVDIPGLIQSSTKGVSDEDVNIVTEITQHYISQPRTICLAVVSAMNDAANQPILQRVRAVDPLGDRTLGIITKPDRLPAGSGSESKFLELARNEDVFFKLGWHVLKNRAFEEGDSSLEARNYSEAKYFRTSNFKTLPKDNVGIESLRSRLSILLFEHVKQELPKLREDLEAALAEAKSDLAVLGRSRSNAAECKAYLAQLSLDYYELCKAGVNGHYEGEYFQQDTDNVVSLDSMASIARLRALVQHLNTAFYDTVRSEGHKYRIDMSDEDDVEWSIELSDKGPTKLSKTQALKWVKQVLVRTRGKELIGNFNPLLIGELFWEQSTAWKRLATDHIEEVSKVCEKFLQRLLEDKSPKDVKDRLWAATILDALKNRRDAAFKELDLIMEDLRHFPINYNHYYTDTIYNRRLNRQKKMLADALQVGTEHQILPGCHSDHTSASVNVDQVITAYSKKADPNMENFSCEDALDCLFAIYKVTQKTFVANITTQVIERHVVRGLEKIFSPVVVNAMLDAEVEAIASEPSSGKRQRDFLTDRIKKLEDGHEIFRGVMGAAR